MDESKVVWEGETFVLMFSEDGDYWWKMKRTSHEAPIPKEMGDYFQKLNAVAMATRAMLHVSSTKCEDPTEDMMLGISTMDALVEAVEALDA